MYVSTARGRRHQERNLVGQANGQAKKQSRMDRYYQTLLAILGPAQEDGPELLQEIPVLQVRKLAALVQNQASACWQKTFRWIPLCHKN